MIFMKSRASFCLDSAFDSTYNFTGYIVKISPIGINGSHGLETKSLELKQTYKVKIKSSPLLYRGLDLNLAILPVVRLCNHEIYSSYRS